MRRYRPALAILFAACSLEARADVRVWEGTLTLPTYEDGLPDPNPPFDIFESTRFNYPYTLRNNLTDIRADHAWRAIYLENEYLKCSVLPDIGGHLYTCIDKLSGRPMFYANPSIKKANIGYRGAWAAFGIEFNFPVSHNWVSMSPVDFAYAKHSDGSASVNVGNIDRVYGMEWNVELVLRPGSTVLEEKVTLSNRSDVRHRFYWWNNAGVQVWDDSQIQYPMRYAASHGFTEVVRWPIDTQERDLSVIHNQTNGPVSLFVHGSREPFMAVWHPHTNTGIVHFANYAELPGKKIWSWGSDADGLDWRKALSDNDSAYVEVQAGLFRNQETYAFLEPRQQIRFSEFWMPVRETGGIARANFSGVLQLTRNGTELYAAFNANKRIPHASIRLLNGKQDLFSEVLDLGPERTWKRQIAIPNARERCTFELKDASGAVLFSHTEGEYDWTPENQIHLGPQPSYVIPAPGSRSEDDWLQLGRSQELNGELLKALATYQEGLKKFDSSFELHKAAGRAAACLARYDEAIENLSPLEMHDVSDPEISYYLGLAYDGTRNERKAEEFYERAYRMPQFRAAAGLRLAELRARAGQVNDAVSFLTRTLRAAPEDLRAIEEMVALRRASGDREAARKLAESWLETYPTSYFLREELGTPDLAHLGADPDRVLNIASEYMRLGMYDSALQVLSRDYPASPNDQSEPGAVLPQDHILIAYFRAFAKAKLGRDAAADYERASHLATRYIFPNRPEAVEVLNAAIKASPSDGAAHYLLGTFLFSRGLTDSALSEWNKAMQFAPSTPVLHADIGRALLYLKNDPHGAMSAFRAGIRADPENTENYFGIDQALSIVEAPASERVDALARYPDASHMPVELVYELILNRAEASQFDAALALFRNRFFAREEGGTNVRQAWIETRLLQTLNLAQTGKCSAAVSDAETLSSPLSGLAFTENDLSSYIESARTQYLLGIVFSRCHDSAKAAAHFQNAAKHTETSDLVWAYAAAKKLGHGDASEWQSKIESALAQVQKNSEANAYTSWGLYNVALLERALGRAQEANADFKRVFLLPDHMLAYHLTRLELAQATPE